MAKQFVLKFGSGKASLNSGLTPTLTIFSYAGLTSATGPGITETPSGSGLYSFLFSPTTTPIIVESDGGAALGSDSRYAYLTIDSVQSVDEKIGTLSDSYGSTASDPSSLLGYMKRNQEFHEGNSNFNKTTGIWDIYTRGSSTLIAEKTLTNTTTTATKS